ncbi:MAG: hypothetical protein LBI63_02545 [Candidatus Ancillula sp.]|jgi:predicted amidophosphoribosyltransferase|nr:hypothetical protein [Candidatus Ancillula sp.]
MTKGIERTFEGIGKCLTRYKITGTGTEALDQNEEEYGNVLINTTDFENSTCDICRTPISTDGFSYCDSCLTENLSDSKYADHVINHFYSRIWFEQYPTKSYMIMDGYKKSEFQLEKYKPLFKLSFQNAFEIHRECFKSIIKNAISHWLFVPSTHIRPDDYVHPIGRIITQEVIDSAFSNSPIFVNCQYDFTKNVAKHTISSDKFILPIQEVHANSHLLIVDDSWTAGANTESIALKAKELGFSEVTIWTVADMVDGRYLNVKSVVNKIKITNKYYTPHFCPIFGVKMKEISKSIADDVTTTNNEWSR